MGSFTAKASSSEGTFELPPSGLNPAVLIGLFDLGTHSRTYQDKTTESRKLLFVWELTAEHRIDGTTFVVGQDFTWSLNKKAKLRPVIEGAIGRSLRDDESFDFGSLLGQPCMVNLTESTTASGKKFVEVSAVSKPLRGLTIPPATREVATINLDDFHSTLDPLDVPEWVPRLYGREVSDEIKASKEWQSLPNF